MQQKQGFRFHFVRSNYITWVWNWLLGLVGKAAEAVLAVTILYSTVQVFTTTDPHIDLGMFLAQQAALDIGGLGLIKLANQAKRDGLTEQAAKARKVSIILMVLMVIGVVVANVESKITTTQTTLDAHHHVLTTVVGFQQSHPIASIVIEILLLIARGTMAVVYGFTIHDLESSMPETAQSPAPAIDVQALISWSMVGMAAQLQQEFRQLAQNQVHRVNDLQTTFDQRLAQLADDQARLFTDLQEQLPTIDTQAIAQTVLASLESRLSSEMKAFQSDMMHRVSVTVASEMAEIVTSDRYKNSTISNGANHSPATSHKLPVITEKHAAVTPGNVRQFPQKTATADDTGAAIIRAYLEDTSRSQRAIAALVGTSEATVNRRLKEYLGTSQVSTNSTDVTA